jgi:diguanylate cyclase (GGDEF)-like protein
MMWMARSFDALFVVEAAIVSFAAAASFRALGAAPPERRQTGWTTLRIGLAAMSLLYLSYVPLYAIHEFSHRISILGYSSLVDLMVSMFLGYGMVIVTTEEANADLRAAMGELAEARNTLARKLNTDPLTSALNRHAFHSMQRGEDVAREHLAGVVLMIDIDNLKRINDTDGHEAGDTVIRAAANAIRGRIRADDLLFRWGGDEFVAVIPNSTLAVVAHRMEPLDAPIFAHSADGPPIEFRLSWGGAEFGPDDPLENAMHIADERMYQSRGKDPAS